MSSSSESEKVQALGTLMVKSPFTGTLEWFDNDEYYPEIDFIIPGLDKPLHLHAPVLVRASQTFIALLKAKTSSHGKYDPESHRLEWMFDKSATDEKYRNCLVKWLRFCYGEDQTFEADETGAALSSLIQLQLKCEDVLKKTIETHMVHISKNDINSGCRMLLDCAAAYEECHLDNLTSVNFVLAKAVF